MTQPNAGFLARGGNICLGAAGLAIHGTTTSTMLTANAFDFAIDGLLYTQPADVSLAFSASHTALGNSEVCIVVFACDAANAITQYQSTPRALADLTDSGGTYQWEWPTITAANVVPYAAVKVATGASATFTFATTDLDAAGITDTYYDLMFIPATRPA